MQSIAYYLQVIIACMKKDIRTTLTERVFTFIQIVIPLEYLVLLLLFLLSANHAPTAVVMYDTGHLAQQLYNTMDQAHTFRLFKLGEREAHDQITAGKIVAVVTIPADFDMRVRRNQPVSLDVEINNLNTDFTEDIRRGVPLSITTFYAKAFPHLVNVVAQEHDRYPQDLDYIRYVGVSILVVGLIVVGIMQAGTSWAREWELETMKELLLCPAPRWCLIAGKMLGAFLMTLASVAVVLTALVWLLGIWPAHWGVMLGYALLTLAISVALGTLLGTLVKQRRLVTTLTLSCAVPLFFVSGPLAPVTFNTKPIQVIASIFPVEYAIAALQYAFYTYEINTLGVGNALILGSFAIGFVVAAVCVLRRVTVAH